MTVEIEAKDAKQAEAMLRAAHKNEDYILDAEHFTGVDLTHGKKK